MSVLNIAPYSGHQFEVGRLMEHYKNYGMKRVEFMGNKVNIYLDEITIKEACINMTQTKMDDVIDLQPPVASAYSYYSPGMVKTILYDVNIPQLISKDEMPRLDTIKIGRMTENREILEEIIEESSFKLNIEEAIVVVKNSDGDKSAGQKSASIDVTRIVIAVLIVCLFRLF